MTPLKIRHQRHSRALVQAAFFNATLGLFADGAQAQDNARQLAAVRRACAVKALPASECGVAKISGAAAPSPVGFQAGDGRTGEGHLFADPQGRYRMSVPAGWDIKLQGDTPTLVNGQAWIAVVATSGATPQAAAQAVGAQFQPAFSRLALVDQGGTQFGRHQGFGITATGLSRAKGQNMSVLVLAIAAGGGHDLVIMSSIPAEHAPALRSGVLGLANSVRFQGE